MKRDKIDTLAKALQISPAYIMGWEEQEKKITNIYPIELKKFPLLGEVSCGVPKFANEDRESYIMAGTEIKADFCLIAKGDSMINARINDGDIIFIRKQDTVENGEIAAVVVNDDNEALLKRFYYYSDKGLLILKPENPAYEDMIYSGEELNHIHVLGKAVAFQSDVKWVTLLLLKKYNSFYKSYIFIIILITYLTGHPKGVMPIRSSLAKGVVLMSTYEEFMIILTVSLLIVSILNMKNKK